MWEVDFFTNFMYHENIVEIISYIKPNGLDTRNMLKPNVQYFLDETSLSLSLSTFLPPYILPISYS